MTKTGKSSTNPVLLAWLTLVVLAAAALLTGTVMAYGGHDPWFTDFDTALAAAKKAQLPVLLVFTGSDWCPLSKKLLEEVFSQKVFTDWARGKIILCILDFPFDKKLISPEQRRKNTYVARRYNIGGYPTELILDSDGSFIGRTLYNEDGPKAYAKRIEEIYRKVRAWQFKLRKLYSMKGKARIDTAASLFRSEDVLIGVDVIPVAEILFEDDKTDSSGLRGDVACVLADSDSRLSAEAEAYLKSISKTDKEHRYGRLLLTRTADDYNKLLKKAYNYRSRGRYSHDVISAAADMEHRLRGIIPYLDERHGLYSLRLELLATLAIQGKKKAAVAELSKIKRLGIPDKKIKGLHRFIDQLYKESARQDGKQDHNHTATKR